MKQKTFKLDLLPGDRVIIPKSWMGLIQHHGLYLGNNLFAENKIGQGVQVVGIQEFFNNDFEITRIERFIGSQQQRNKVVQKAWASQGREYDLFAFNCEHYCNEILFNKPQSKQVDTFLTIAGLSLFTWLLTSKA